MFGRFSLLTQQTFLMIVGWICESLQTIQVRVIQKDSNVERTLSEMFSCPEQLNRWPCPLLGPTDTIRVLTTLQSDPGDFWPLRHLKRHDLTKNTYLLTYLPTYLPPLENTLKTFNFFDKRSNPRDLWLLRQSIRGDMTFLPTYLPTHLPASGRLPPELQNLIIFTKIKCFKSNFTPNKSVLIATYLTLKLNEIEINSKLWEKRLKILSNKACLKTVI